MENPKYQLGDVVTAEVGRPPWTKRIVPLTIDGLRLVTEYAESWAEPDGPNTWAAKPAEWEYRLMTRGRNKDGCEEIDDSWGWIKESKLQPAEVPVAS